MSDPLPVVTIIIPARPGQEEIAALSAVGALDYPAASLEIIVARGRQPAVQRNTALRTAKGSLIYFLDDDSRPRADSLKRGVAHFADPRVKIVGGPNLCPPGAPWLEQVFAVVLSSWLAFGPSRARYESVGTTRETSEKELILCNLMARRDALLEFGGFDESLYPNEENALMDQIQNANGKMIYDPAFIVFRRPRSNLRAFCKMLLTYGRGRAEQFRLHPTAGSILNFVPPAFCLYLLVVPWFGVIGLIPLGFYGLAVLGHTIVLATKKPIAKTLAAAPLIVLTHILYGAGFWRGLFTKLKRSQSTSGPPVTLETIQP